MVAWEIHKVSQRTPILRKINFFVFNIVFYLWQIGKVAEAAAPAQARGGKIPHFPRNSAKN
jgi:hypothetical protein